MENNIQYRIYNIDGKRMLSESRLEKKGHFKIYTIDINDGSSTVLNRQNPVKRKNANALFDQIIEQEHLDAKDENSLLHYIVEIDCKYIFNSKLSKEEEDKKDTILNPASKYYSTRYGINIVFSNEEYLFVPFDKSGSMTRENRITFIREKIKGKLDLRLCLHFPYEYLSIDQSKFFAYRGLYLSDAKKIDLSIPVVDKTKNRVFNISFNENTIIVIKDQVNNKENLDDPNLSAGIYTNSSKQNKDGYFDFYQKELNDLKTENSINEYISSINSFDGEGLISSEYSAYLNAYLIEEGYLKKRATSFQIRMPFVKGVLHEVDFHRFFKEELGEGGAVITDYLGVKRDLSKANIILTESMFKAAKWIKLLGTIYKEGILPPTNTGRTIKGLAHWPLLKEKIYQTRNIYYRIFEKDKEIDFMKLYFYMFDKYKHSLYIRMTDASFASGNNISLNLQFISTLDLNKADMSSFINKHKKELNDIKKLLNIDDVIEEDERSVFNGNDTWQKALTKNEDFCEDPFVVQQANYRRNALIKDTVNGRLVVEGENRFFSGDLLSFLLHLYSLSDKYNIEKKNKIKLNCLDDNDMYLPNSPKELKEGDYCVLLRNPHLSRNEEALAKVRNTNLYVKYFDHLHGVVMISSQSLIPNILGGADFDGDIVKIIYNKTIVNSVKKAVYVSNNEDQEKDGQQLKRKLPIVIITSPEAEKNKESYFANNVEIRIDTLNNTFSNNIGLISNLAFKFAQIGSEKLKKYLPDAEFKCPQCTIITGLDIDAAKNGIHPNKNIQKLQDEYSMVCSKLSDRNKSAENYLKIKDSTKEANSRFGQQIKIEEESKDNKIIIKINEIPFELNVDNKDTNNMTMLIRAFVDLSKEKGFMATKPTRKLFIFEKDEWEKSLDKNKKKQVKTIMETCLAYIKLDKKRRNLIREQNERTFDGRALNCFIKIFGSLDYKVDSLIDVRSAYEITKKYLADKDVLLAAIEYIKEKKTQTKEEYYIEPEQLIKMKKYEIIKYIVKDMKYILDFYDGFKQYLSDLSVVSKTDADAIKGLLYRNEYQQKEVNIPIIIRYMLMSIAVGEQEYYEEQLTTDKLNDETYKPVFEKLYEQVIYDGDDHKYFKTKAYNLAKDIINSIFNNNSTESLKYVYSICRDAWSKPERTEFMWNVIPEKIILDQIEERGRRDA